MMIKIICDQYGLHQQQADDYIVMDETQYEEAYEILNSPEKLNAGCIVVRNPALFHWFDAPARRFACIVIHLDPVAELAKLLNRHDIKRIFRNNPEWIIELKLIEKAEHERIRYNEPAEFWLRRILLGPSWLVETEINGTDILEILKWLAKHEEQNLHYLTRKLMTEQLQRWSAADSSSAEFFRWLVEAPFQRAKVLAWEQMLRKYPQNIVSMWFQHVVEWNSLNLIANYQRSFPDLNVSLPEGIAVFLKAFLDEEWSRSPIRALSFLSGRLECERTFLLTKLQSLLRQGITLEQDVYNKISQLNNITQAVSLARKLLPAKEPSYLPDSVSIENLQEWLRDEYLPYSDSCATLKIMEKTEPFVEQFENWLKRNYSNLLIDGTGMAYRQVLELKSRLDDGPILIYVFDGLDYLGGQDLLLPSLEQAGAYAESSIAPLLTFLPSETFIAKPTIVSGWMNSQLPIERPDASFYRKLVIDSFNLDEAEVVSATDKDSTLYELIQNYAKVYLYLDNQLDREYLHAVLTPYTRREKYSSHLKKQAEAIIEAVKIVKEQHGENLCVCVCSDHGYTELPQSIRTVETKKSITGKTRSMVIKKSAPFEQGVEKSIWRLKAGLYGIHEEMAIPLGYSCFGKKPRGAAHGGCTPQEVAVPWFILSFEKPQVAVRPSISVEGDIFRKRKENRLTVSLSNPNNYVLSILDISLHGIEFFTQLPLQIKPHQVCSLDASFDAVSVRDALLTIRGALTMRHRFGKEKIPIELKITTKGAMMDEFDDDFEF